MKKINKLFVLLLLLIVTGCSSVIATRSTFDIAATELNQHEVLNIVEDILKEEGMIVANLEDKGGYKVVKASEVINDEKGKTATDMAMGIAIDYFIGHDEFRLFFVLDDGKMYLYGTQRRVKDKIFTKTYEYVNMDMDYGNASLMKMNKISAKIKEGIGMKGRVWNTTGKGLGSKYGVN